MRIIGGEARGRKLKSPPGRTVRPTLSRVREGLFDMLAPRLPGARFLDLFAGTGAVGLEAASRGAAAVVLVEVSDRQARTIRENIQALAVEARVRLIRAAAGSALPHLAQAGKCFDVIFLDPPYDRPEAVVSTLEVISQWPGLVCPQGVVVAQHDSRLAMPDQVGACRLARARRFGDSTLSFYHLAEPPGGA